MTQAAVGSLVARLDLGVEPFVQVLREVLQEQRDARRSIPDGLDPVAYLRSAVPVGDGAVDVGEFLRQRCRARQHPPVIHQREALVFGGEHPVRCHDVHGEFPPHPEAGPAEEADAVLAEQRQVEQVRRGPDVFGLPFQVGEWHSLYEDRGSDDLQQRRLPADAGADRCGPVHEFAQRVVAVQSQGSGDGAVGAQSRLV
ncbi:hypothetical protein [Nocardia brasiliensis]|uniref:Uncharacterized protein n=1 Tax=Nocardia brasiliensis (strain ATCC 700358 / HUJEG-1) TaxID=1133849 RepID=K0ERP7_NOCB7|nr:hypothetical protein [Nocardia brasiliensis]AFT99494.1 hypothetical protein O3I_007660 [Nocardia brasiliensis ATCC 700358]